MKIHLSGSTSDIIKNRFPYFVVEYRGKIPIKGKGDMETYWLSERTVSVAEQENLESIEKPWINNSLNLSKKHSLPPIVKAVNLPTPIYDE